MRVLLLGPYPPPHGGVQTNLVAIRELLLARGHRCCVINLHRHRSGRGECVYHPATAPGVLMLLLRLRYDIVHLHLGGDVSSRLLALSAVCASIPWAKSVLTFHSGGYASSPAGRSANPRTLKAAVFRRLDRVVAVNPEIVRLFRRLGVPASNVRLIPPHTLPPRPEAALPPAIEEFFRAHSPVFVTVGLLEPEYDLSLQIDAMPEFRRRFPRAGLLIIGDGSLAAQLRTRIEKHPEGEHILLAGDVPHAATLRAISEAGVFLRTTLYDGDSVSVREALHLGTPVVATDNRMRPPGPVLIPARDRAALVEAVQKCVSAPPPARNAMPADHTNVEAVLDLYFELLR